MTKAAFLSFCLLVVNIICGTGSPILLFTAFPHHQKMLVDVALLLRSAGHQAEFLSYQNVMEPFHKHKIPVHLVRADLNLTFSVSVDPTSQTYNFQSEFDNLKPVLELLVDWCHYLLSDNVLHSLLKTKNYKVFVMDLFANDACSLALARKLGIPVVGIWPSRISQPFSFYAGIPSLTSFVPATGIELSSFSSFTERIANNLALYNELKEWNRYFYNPVITTINKHFDDPLGVEDIYEDIAVVLVNENPVLDDVRPILPHVLPVGGFHCSVPDKLANNVEEFVTSFKGGIIYVSLESDVYSRSVLQELSSALGTAVSTFPIFCVIWDSETFQLNNKSENIMAVEDVSQDILGHPRTRLFISTCDRASTFSAVFHGVPVLCIPLSIHQWENALSLDRRNTAVVLGKSDFSVDKIVAAIHTLLKKKRFTDTARHLSVIFRDQPEAPADRLLYWVDYVMRHESARHLKSIARRLSVYRYYNMDIMLFFLGLGGLSCTILIGLLYMTFRLIMLSPDKKKTKDE